MEVLSVSQVNSLIEKSIVESNINDKYIEGEMSNITYQKSGHLYFSLKDETSLINCAIFSYMNKNIPINLKEGDKVKILANISYYKPMSKITFIASSLEKLDNIGFLYKQLEELKKEYQEKGYFLDDIKKKKPRLVKRIGVVTAPSGAVIHDIEETTKKRDKNVEIYLYPSKVQGEGAAEEIANGINFFNENNEKYQLDAIIVGRGGGSIEDLWCFNDKKVVEAIHNSKIFVVSSVGHESDVVLSDLVADLRASTPTQAAMYLISVQNDELDKLRVYKEKIYTLINNRINIENSKILNLKNSYILRNINNTVTNNRQKIMHLEEKLIREVKNNLKNKYNEINDYKNKIDLNNIFNKLNNYKYKVKSSGEKIEEILSTNLLNKKNNLEILKIKVEKHSVEDILKKGYSITYKNDKIIKSLSEVNKGDKIKTVFAFGEINSIIEGE